MNVPGTRVVFSDDTIDAILDDVRTVLRSGQLSNGSFVCELETSFRELLVPEMPHAVGVSSGTGALEIALRALGVSGAIVVCPTNTYAATAWSILASGNTPLFVGCDEELQLSVDDLERALQRPDAKHIAAVVVTHVGGVISSRIEDVIALGRQQGLRIIEDAAHAHGARTTGRHAGSVGDASAFSLFATKVVTSGEGGVALFRDGDAAETARVLRDQGKKPGTGNVHLMRGYNWRLSEPSAIIARHHLNSLSTRRASRAAVSARYVEALSDIRGLEHLQMAASGQPSYYKHIVFTDLDFDGLPQSGQVYELPLHVQPVFAELAINGVGEVHRNLGRHRCLPLYDFMPEEHVNAVIEGIRDRAAERVA